MKIKSLGKNTTEVENENYRILISYETPVACIDKISRGFYETSRIWSTTTTRHINQWKKSNDYDGMGKFLCSIKSQGYFDNLLD